MSGLRPKRRSDVRTQVVADELVILDRGGETIHHLNTTAAFVWGACDGTLTPSELAERLATRFEVAPEAAARDVAQLLGELQRLNLLEPLPSGPASPATGAR
jgi:hypothetical protein